MLHSLAENPSFPYGFIEEGDRLVWTSSSAQQENVRPFVSKLSTYITGCSSRGIERSRALPFWIRFYVIGSLLQPELRCGGGGKWIRGGNWILGGIVGRASFLEVLVWSFLQRRISKGWWIEDARSIVLASWDSVFSCWFQSSFGRRRLHVCEVEVPWWILMKEWWFWTCIKLKYCLIYGQHNVFWC